MQLIVHVFRRLVGIEKSAFNHTGKLNYFFFIIKFNLYLCMETGGFKSLTA